MTNGWVRNYRVFRWVHSSFLKASIKRYFGRCLIWKYKKNPWTTPSGEFSFQLRRFQYFVQISKTPPLIPDIADIIYFHIPQEHAGTFLYGRFYCLLRKCTWSSWINTDYRLHKLHLRTYYYKYTLQRKVCFKSYRNEENQAYLFEGPNLKVISFISQFQIVLARWKIVHLCNVSSASKHGDDYISNAFEIILNKLSYSRVTCCPNLLNIALVNLKVH